MDCVNDMAEKAKTLREVAEKAGVATSTVSRALRNHPSIPKSTCDRIQALAKEMGYRPDPLIAALVDRRWRGGSIKVDTIAYVTHLRPEEHRKVAFFDELFRGATARADELGYQLEEYWLEKKKMTGMRMSSILRNRGIRGVCIAPMPKGLGHVHLQWDHFSCATIGYSMVRPNLHRACPHHLQGIMETLRQLRHRGHRRIGVWMMRDENSKTGYNWTAGIHTFQSLYPDVTCSLLLSRYWDPEEFGRWVKENDFDCVLGSSEWVRSSAEKMSLKVDLATLSWFQQGGMMGLDQKPAQVGAAAIDLIVSQIRLNETGIPEHPRAMMIEGSWRDGS